VPSGAISRHPWCQVRPSAKHTQSTVRTVPGQFAPAVPTQHGQHHAVRLCCAPRTRRDVPLWWSGYLANLTLFLKQLLTRLTCGENGHRWKAHGIKGSAQNRQPADRGRVRQHIAWLADVFRADLRPGLSQTQRRPAKPPPLAIYTPACPHVYAPSGAYVGQGTTISHRNLKDFIHTTDRKRIVNASHYPLKETKGPPVLMEGVQP
jgi:hypothetical protein